MVHANLTAGATSLSSDLERTASFDREGRLLHYTRRDRTYRRTLGSDVYLRFRRQGRRWLKLAPDQAREVLREAYELARRVRDEAPAELRRRLDGEILRWTIAALVDERRRFAAAYRPLSILPPDRYLSIVLQATEGCTWNRCTFCNFYMDRPFAAKTAESFARHAQAVKELLGAGVSLRRGVFLADGNALALSRRRLEPILGIARRLFPSQPIYGFVDLYSGEHRPTGDWAELAALGVRRVYIGMETGLDKLLALVNKPGSCSELQVFVAELKQAALQVCLIVMVGLGGREFRQLHRRATVAAIREMPLGPGDLIYLSPFVEHRDSVYHRQRLAAGLTPMSDSEVEAELGRLAVELRRGGLRVSRYDIREFIY